MYSFNVKNLKEISFSLTAVGWHHIRCKLFFKFFFFWSDRNLSFAEIYLRRFYMFCFLHFILLKINKDFLFTDKHLPTRRNNHTNRPTNNWPPNPPSYIWYSYTSFMCFSVIRPLPPAFKFPIQSWQGPSILFKSKQFFSLCYSTLDMMFNNRFVGALWVSFTFFLFFLFNFIIFFSFFWFVFVCG